MRKTLYLLPLCAPVVLAGCFSSGSSNDDDTGDPTDPVNGGSETAAFAKFNAAEETPFPNPMLFDDEAQLVAFDVDDPDDLTDQRAAYNTRDGFSTVAPMWVDFSTTLDEVDQKALEGAIQVVGVEVDEDGDGDLDISLADDVDFPDVQVTVSRVDGSRVYLKPRTPLEPEQHYLVTIEKGAFEADNGEPVGASDEFADALEGESGNADLDRYVQAYNDYAQDGDIGDLALAFHFQTQTTTSVLQALADDPEAQLVTEGPNDRGSYQFDGLTAYDGLMELPYYLAIPETDDGGPRGPNNLITADTNPLETRWTQSAPGDLPVDPETIEVPYLMTVPDGDEPADGWPVTVVYHGLTGNRTQLFFIAEALADEGLAAIHIDQPFGGVLEDTFFFDGEEFSSAWFEFGDAERERHFFTDYSGDGEADAAGDNFSGTGYPLTVRDNRRQAVADLIHLIATIQAGNFNDNGVNLDGDSITYTGLSNAGIQGATLAGVTDRVDAFSLAVPSGGLAKLPDGAPAFQGQLRERYPELGRGTAGTVEFEESLILEQGIIDAGDPINYARKAGEKHPIHMIGVVGTAGDPGQLPDLVVPTQVYATGANPTPEFGDYDLAQGSDFNEVYLGAPLTGAEPLARVMGLEPTATNTEDPEGVDALMRFVRGTHQTWLIQDAESSRDDEALTEQMQRQTAVFLKSGGTNLEVGDTSSLLDPQ